MFKLESLENEGFNEKDYVHSFTQNHLLLGCATSYGTPGIFRLIYNS